MRIAQIAPLWVPVPPITHGGTEYIVSLLTEELIKRGHDVTLFASGDSHTSGKLVSTCPKAIWRDRTLEDPHACILHLIKKAVQSAHEFDIIHNHLGFYFAPFAQELETPVVHTLHRPIYPETNRLYQETPNTHFVAISRDQAASAAPLTIEKIIYHGIRIDQYPFSANPKGYLLFLSKIDEEKGIIEAIEAARIAKQKLILAGNIVGKKGHEFFVRRVKPRLDGKNIEYAGQADFNKKIELLSGADALLFPIRRREPFGIVMIEALMCGTPVIAFPKGSVPEIIEDGKTGFLARSTIHMAHLVKKIPEINRNTCRKVAEERFSLGRMVDEYEKLYRDILERHP